MRSSCYRRKQRSERAFRTCNLRKSKGFYLVKQGADPIPGAWLGGGRIGFRQMSPMKDDVTVLLTWNHAGQIKIWKNTSRLCPSVYESEEKLGWIVDVEFGTEKGQENGDEAAWVEMICQVAPD